MTRAPLYNHQFKTNQHNLLRQCLGYEGTMRKLLLVEVLKNMVFSIMVLLHLRVFAWINNLQNKRCQSPLLYKSAISQIISYGIHYSTDGNSIQKFFPSPGLLYRLYLRTPDTGYQLFKGNGARVTDLQTADNLYYSVHEYETHSGKQSRRKNICQIKRKEWNQRDHLWLIRKKINIEY